MREEQREQITSSAKLNEPRFNRKLAQLQMRMRVRRSRKVLTAKRVKRDEMLRGRQLTISG